MVSLIVQAELVEIFVLEGLEADNGGGRGGGEEEDEEEGDEAHHWDEFGRDHPHPEGHPDGFILLLAEDFSGRGGCMALAMSLYYCYP